MFKRAVVAISAIFILFTMHFPAGAAAAGGAIVFSEVTRHHPSGPDGEPTSSPSTGGLFAFENGRVKQLTTDPADREPSFSPDGSRIVFVRKGDVWTVRPGGFGLRQLTSGADLDSHPQVAPNGRYVLFERRLLQHPGHDLYTSDLQGAVIRPLAATAGDEHEASFSSDGRQIAYVRKDEGGKNHIWSVRPMWRPSGDSGPWDESLVILDSATGHRTQTVRMTLNLEGSEHPSILGSVVTWQPAHRHR